MKVSLHCGHKRSSGGFMFFSYIPLRHPLECCLDVVDKVQLGNIHYELQKHFLRPPSLSTWYNETLLNICGGVCRLINGFFANHIRHHGQTIHLSTFFFLSPTSDLPETPVDLVINCLDSHENGFLRDQPWYKTAADWANQNRAPVLSIDPPVSGQAHAVEAKWSLSLGLPLPLSEGAGRVYLCDIGIPRQVFQEVGIKYHSPFGCKFVVPLHSEWTFDQVTESEPALKIWKWRPVGTNQLFYCGRTIGEIQSKGSYGRNCSCDIPDVLKVEENTCLLAMSAFHCLTINFHLDGFSWSINCAVISRKHQNCLLGSHLLGLGFLLLLRCYLASQIEDFVLTLYTDALMYSDFYFFSLVGMGV